MIPIQRLGDLSAEARQTILARAHGAFEEIMPLVARILDDVRARGDAALREYTARFDGATLDDLRVSDAEFAAARAAAAPALLEALAQAARNVATFHRSHVAYERP